MKLNKLALHSILITLIGLFGLSAELAIAKEKPNRVYELRTYTTLPGRLTALNARFAGHTMKLFEKHGMRNEAYWIPTDDAHKDNTLIYVISHESQEAAVKNWKEFNDDPEWVKVREASEADGKILAKAPESIFMTMTDYSPSLSHKQ